MRIRAAVLHAYSTPLSVEEVELEPPRTGEVLVRVAAAGVCHSDLHLADGHLGPGRVPMVLGPWRPIVAIPASCVPCAKSTPGSASVMRTQS